MSLWKRSFSNRFNALPLRSRMLANLIETEHRIIQLEHEKTRLKLMYQKTLKLINEEIKYNQGELRKSGERFDEEYPEAT